MKAPRFYPIVDTRLLEERGIAITAATTALLEAGAQILQLRHKLDWTGAVYDQASVMSELCRSAGVLLVINDRADIALLLGAAVHIGQDDMPSSQVRGIAGRDRIVGLSTHNEAQFRAATSEPVDYLALGPIFGTRSKENPDPVVGLAELARLRRLTDKPVVAIGGITRETASEVWLSGADSAAVVGDLYPPDSSKRTIRRVAEEWIRLANEYAAN